MPLHLAAQRRLVDAGLDRVARLHGLVLCPDGDGSGLDDEPRLVEGKGVIVRSRERPLDDGIVADDLALVTGQAAGQRVSVHQSLLAVGQRGVGVAVGLALCVGGHGQRLPGDFHLDAERTGGVVVGIGHHLIPCVIGSGGCAGGEVGLIRAVIGLIPVSRDGIVERAALDGARLEQRLGLAAVDQGPMRRGFRLDLRLQYGHGQARRVDIRVIGIAHGPVPGVVGLRFDAHGDGFAPSGIGGGSIVRAKGILHRAALGHARRQQRLFRAIVNQARH